MQTILNKHLQAKLVHRRDNDVMDAVAKLLVEHYLCAASRESNIVLGNRVEYDGKILCMH
mgnify:CR=1 FL=1